MKLATLVIVTVLLAACRSSVHESHAPAQSADAAPASTLDFSAWRGTSMTVEEFVKVCQEVSDFNFTYTAETQAILNARTIRLAGADRVTVDQFESFLETQLAVCGLTSEPVGPEHLHVLHIQPRGS